MKKQTLRTALTVIIALTSILVSTARTWSVDDMPNPQNQRVKSLVADPDNILQPATILEVNRILDDIQKQSGAQVAVAVVGDTDTDIDSWATALFDAWGVGKEGANTGVLFVVARDSHRYAIRTGRGITAVLPDVTTARIARNEIVPRFKAGDIDGGIVAGVSALHAELTTDDAVSAIKAAHERENKAEEMSLLDIVMFYIWFSIGLTVLLFVWFMYRVHKTSGLERHTRYEELHPMKRILYGLSFVGLGIPLLVYFPARSYLRNLRDGEHICPNCGTKMNKIDEIHDNEHLTPAQDAEERYNSVDYDVWHCSNCGEEDVYAYANQDSPLVECPNCHARTARYLRDRVVRRPTTTTDGLAVKEYECLNCHTISQKPFKLPKTPPTDSGGAAAAGIAAGILLGGLGGRGGGGFGGFGGGFGGGTTGGSGTSGGW